MQFCCFIITDFISIIIFSILLVRFNKLLFVFIIIFCLILVLVTFIFNKVIKKFKKKNINYNDLVNSYLVESFSNIDVVKNRHLEKRFYDIFSL